jgi:hypothetical protein
MSKILIDEAVVRQALEALEKKHGKWGQGHDELNAAAITALRQALEQPAQRPPNCGTGYCSCVECLFEQPAPAQEPDDERIAALRTLDYCHGLKAGWNFCVANDDAGFERAMDSTGEAVRILKKQPVPAQPLTEQFVLEIAREVEWSDRNAINNEELVEFASKLQARVQEPLTDEQVEKLRHNIDWTASWSYINFARAIEAAHGIK